MEAYLASEGIAAFGRYGDTRLAHVAPGELVVPLEVQTPDLIEHIATNVAAMGSDPWRYVVGSPYGSYNPITGQQEFFWGDVADFFSDVGKLVLPIAGATVGNILLPGFGGAIGGMLGSAAAGAIPGGGMLPPEMMGIASFLAPALAGPTGSMLGLTGAPAAGGLPVGGPHGDMGAADSGGGFLGGALGGLGDLFGGSVGGAAGAAGASTGLESLLSNPIVGGGLSFLAGQMFADEPEDEFDPIVPRDYSDVGPYDFALGRSGRSPFIDSSYGSRPEERFF